VGKAGSFLTILLSSPACAALRRDRQPFLRLAVVVHLAGIVSAFGQGNLTPPGPPAPIMKTLDQVEPRIPIDATHTPGDANYAFIITQPGSYYLPGNLAILRDGGIYVAVAGVTLDLGGFQMSHVVIGAGDAIDFDPAASRGVVKNGSITGFSKAVVCLSGSAAEIYCEHLLVNCNNSRVVDLGNSATIKDCQIQVGGIIAGVHSVIRDTTVTTTGTDVNVELGDDSQVIGLNFTTGRGVLSVGLHGLIADCQINAGGPPTFLINGDVVVAGDGSVLRNCTVSAGNVAGNAINIGSGALVTNCRVVQAFRDGISGQSNVIVETCAVQGNGRSGIIVGPNAVVRDCAVRGSGGAGISVGENSSVTSCVVSNCGIGGISSNFENVSITHCTLKGNSGGPGISLLSGTVADCDVAATTGGPGIQVTQKSQVLRNRSENNGISGNARSGIRVIGPNNRVEGNQLVNNSDFGLEITQNGALNLNTGNFVAGNNARGNTSGSFSISAGNAVGPQVSTANLGANTNPAANYVP
jgi:hypothetical protein